MIQRLFFWLTYALGRPRWDTGITPPEIVRLIEVEGLPHGRAIDLGCGTGATAVYLAGRGWDVVGIDFVPKPLMMAQHRAEGAGVSRRVRFIQADVLQVDGASLGLFDLAVDIGCGHSLPSGEQPRYARRLGSIIRPGGILMTYMFLPSPGRAMGLSPEAVEKLFAPEFKLVWNSLGRDIAAHAGSAWYRFERMEKAT